VDINTKATRIDKDLSGLKNYCDNFKSDTIKELFSIEDKDDDLLKNDNIGHGTEFDLITFEKENSEEHQTIMAEGQEKATANGEYFA
jgi:hypothetical protein